MTASLEPTLGGARCPACEEAPAKPFYRVTGVPTTDVRLFRDRQAARAVSRGTIDLALCRACSYVWNAAFEPGLVEYADDYESTQACSPTFGRFHERLARELVTRHDLVGKEVLEIGCGQGEFLAVLLGLGIGRAVGYDPAYDGRLRHPDLEIVPHLFPDATAASLRPDFACCKMTLEHIADPLGFMLGVRRGLRAGVPAFFQVPNFARILAQRAFWDVYYEHCGYFSAASLAGLLERSGFAIDEVRTAYDDQYLAALVTVAEPVSVETRADGTEALAREVERFAAGVEDDRRRWRDWLEEEERRARRVAVWGGGSKAVAFLTALAADRQIAVVVDINPRKRDTFLPGTGHRVTTPEALSEGPPDTVILMNPIYRAEVRATLIGLGLTPTIVTVEDRIGGPDPGASPG